MCLGKERKEEFFKLCVIVYKRVFFGFRGFEVLFFLDFMILI